MNAERDRQADLFVWLATTYGNALRGSVCHEIAAKAREVFGPPTPAAPDVLPMVAGRQPEIYEHRGIWKVGETDQEGARLSADGIWVDYWDAGSWPTREAAEVAVRQFAERERLDNPKPAERELPDAPGIWFRVEGEYWLVSGSATNDGGFKCRLIDAGKGCLGSLNFSRWQLSPGGWRRADAGEASALREKLAAAEKRIVGQRKDLKRLHAAHDDMLARLGAQGTLLLEYMEQLAAAQAELAALRGQWVAGPPPEGERRWCRVVRRGKAELYPALVGYLEDDDRCEWLIDDDAKVVSPESCEAHWTGPCPPAYAAPGESEVGK